MKVNHDCETLYDNVILQSYLLIFFNVCFFTLLQAFILDFLLPYFKTKFIWLEKYLVKWNENVKLRRNRHKEKIQKAILEAELAEQQLTEMFQNEIIKANNDTTVSNPLAHIVNKEPDDETNNLELIQDKGSKQEIPDEDIIRASTAIEPQDIEAPRDTLSESFSYPQGPESEFRYTQENATTSQSLSISNNENKDTKEPLTLTKLNLRLHNQVFKKQQSLKQIFVEGEIPTRTKSKASVISKSRQITHHRIIKSIPRISEVSEVSRVSFEEWLDSRMTGKFLFLCLQLFFGFIAFVLTAVHSHRSAYHYTRFDRYQNFYGLLINSSYLTSLTSAFFYIFNLNFEELIGDANSDVPAEIYILFSTSYFAFYPGLIILLPAIITHLIPALIIYIWVWVPIIVLIAMGGFATHHIIHFCLKHVITLTGHDEYLLREYRNIIIVRFIVTFLFQTLFNYMTLFYSYDDSPINQTHYMDVIHHEYDLRSQTWCLLENYDKKVVNQIVFFNWL